MLVGIVLVAAATTCWKDILTLIGFDARALEADARALKAELSLEKVLKELNQHREAEQRRLSSGATADQFSFQELISDMGCAGVLFKVSAVQSPGTFYALKVVRNYGIGPSKRLKSAFYMAGNMLCLPSCPTTPTLSVKFIDPLHEQFAPYMGDFVQEAQNFNDDQVRKAQYVVFEYHPTNLERHLSVTGTFR